MILKTFSIENFRGIDKLVLELDGTTVLIGENNTGKTSVLEALFTCMNRGVSRRAMPFAEYDFHLTTPDSEPASAPPLVLTLKNGNRPTNNALQSRWHPRRLVAPSHTKQRSEPA